MIGKALSSYVLLMGAVYHADYSGDVIGKRRKNEPVEIIPKVCPFCYFFSPTKLSAYKNFCNFPFPISALSLHLGPTME